MGTMKFKKKLRKNSGKRTHGFGNCKGHRNTGHKAGHGITNTWKKGMKSFALKQKSLGYPTKKYGKNHPSPWIHGKHGFNRPQKLRRINATNCINIGSVNAQIDQWVEKELCEKSGSIYSVDLENLGYQKLLARGSIDKKINIIVKKASAYAIEEIENIGGTVKLTIEK
ncbi:MAG: uL15m family ribosomal protein [Promethearchaeota archaeon]